MFREFPPPASTGPATFPSLLPPLPRSPHYRRTRPPCTGATPATYLRPSPLRSRCLSTTSTRLTETRAKARKPPDTAEGTLYYLWRKNVSNWRTCETCKWRMLANITLKYFISMKFSLSFFFKKKTFQLSRPAFVHTFLRDLQRLTP